MVESVGDIVTELYHVFFLFVVLPAMRGHGEKAAAKPWEAAEGLEWEGL